MYGNSLPAAAEAAICLLLEETGRVRVARDLEDFDLVALFPDLLKKLSQRSSGHHDHIVAYC